MLKLLIADDELIEREALHFIIGGSCPAIGTIEDASNGREAISKNVTFKPDIIIMDIKMPGVNGIEASKIIRQFNAECRIILLTAFNYFDYAKEAIKIGVKDFLVKPVQNDEIIEVINSVADSINSERKKKRKQSDIINRLEHATKYLENELVSSFIVGDTEENQIEEYFDIMEIKFKSGFCLVVNINYVSDFSEVISQLQKDMIRKRCIEKIKQKFAELNNICLVSNIKNDIYIIVLSEETLKPVEAKERPLMLTNIVYKFPRENTAIDVCIGIGECFDNARDINSSFLQAKEACECKGPGSGVTHFSDIQQNYDTLQYPKDKEKELCKHLLMCDWNSCSVVADKIFNWISQSYNSLEDIRVIAYEILIVIDKYLDWEANIGSNDTLVYFKNIKKAQSSYEVKMCVKNILRNNIEKLSNTNLDKHQVLIKKACEQIKKYYMKDISLDEMASMTGLSSFYFSKVFKHYKKMNFIEYLTHIRTQKAKELLINPVNSIKDIGEMVGYNDSNYFTRVFKRVEGITPTEYRNKKML